MPSKSFLRTLFVAHRFVVVLFESRCTHQKRTQKALRMNDSVFWLFAFAPIFVFASGLVMAQDTPEAELTLKPKLCIVKRGDSQCSTDVDVRWSATSENTFCLYRSGRDGALQCWSKGDIGEFLDQLIASQDTPYWLEWQSDLGDVVAARAILKVVSVVPEDRRRSRRRRHIWSVF